MFWEVREEKIEPILRLRPEKGAMSGKALECYGGDDICSRKNFSRCVSILRGRGWERGLYGRKRAIVVFD